MKKIQKIIETLIIVIFLFGVMIYSGIVKLDAFVDTFSIFNFIKRWNLLMETSDSFSWLVNIIVYPLAFICLFQLIVMVIMLYRKELQVLYMMIISNLTVLAIVYSLMCLFLR